MLSSKQLLERMGISRATLNNYISLGILPRPDVKRTEPEDGRAPRVGYFPDSTLDVIERVNRLKREGHSIADIAEVLSTERGATPPKREHVETAKAAPTPAPSMGVAPLMLTIDEFKNPAYLVNNKFEVEWANDEAARDLLGLRGALPADITERNIFRLFLEGAVARESETWDAVLDFHLSIAKKRLSKSALFALDLGVDSERTGILGDLYDKADAVEPSSVLHRQVNLGRAGEPARWHNVYATFFREGVFFAYVPVVDESDALLNLLSRRDVVIRDLLQHRRPYLTPLAVLVSDIQDSVKICAELPPEEYFELINHVWAAMSDKLRKYYATYGKHVGDGMVYYFFPQPDCNYILNAMRCAHELKETMRSVSREWQNRKNWTNELKLNIGIDEGEEWFGSYRTPVHLEFTALGDTINRASRLSDFARDGSVWATKNMLGKLTATERGQVRFGIRRRAEDGERLVIPSSYSRISNLVELDDVQNIKFKDIAVLPVTEILDVATEDALATASY